VVTVAADIREIIRAGAAIGLSLNVDKCKLITQRDFQMNDALLLSFFNFRMLPFSARH